MGWRIQEGVGHPASVEMMDPLQLSQSPVRRQPPARAAGRAHTSVWVGDRPKQPLQAAKFCRANLLGPLDTRDRFTGPSGKCTNNGVSYSSFHGSPSPGLGREFLATKLLAARVASTFHRYEHWVPRVLHKSDRVQSSMMVVLKT